MLTFTQLREQLGLSQPSLTKLISEGLPHTLDGRAKVFDEGEVARWLIDTGRAVVEGEQPQSKIARTRRECADHFGVHLRTVADWLEDPSFPGRSGTRGLRDGYFPLEDIQEWLEARDAVREGGPRIDVTDRREELLAVRIEREGVRIQRERRQLEEEEGQLARVDEMVELVRRLTNTAKRLLESLPDEAAKDLPSDMPPDIRTKIVKRWRQRVFEVERVISEALSGDTDTSDESEG